MKALPIVDGKIVHSRGALPMKLQGTERARAHADIMAFCNPAHRASPKHPAYVRAVVNIVRNDPSLLIEALPKQCPLEGHRNENWATADLTWSNQRRWHGTWLGRFADVTFDALPVVEVALRAGVHPDDPEVWPEGGLLKPEFACLQPKMLELALRHGASPNAGLGWYHSYLWHSLHAVSCGLPSCDKPLGRRETMAGIRCAELLLAAGTTEIDPEPSEVLRGVTALRNRNKTAVGMLADACGSGWVDAEIASRLLDLVRQLHARGADIDRRNGDYSAPPVIQAIWTANEPLVRLLIELGCRVDDEAVVRRGSPGDIGTISEEARRIGDEAFAASITEWVMSRRIADLAKGPLRRPAHAPAGRASRAAL